MKKNQKVDKHIEALDRQIELLTVELDSHDSYSDEYTDTAENIAKLIGIRDTLVVESKSKGFGRINPDILVQGAMGIATTLLILKYEQTEIITSKAFNLATRMIGR